MLACDGMRVGTSLPSPAAPCEVLWLDGAASARPPGPSAERTLPPSLRARVCAVPGSGASRDAGLRRRFPSDPMADDRACHVDRDGALPPMSLPSLTPLMLRVSTAGGCGCAIELSDIADPPASDGPAGLGIPLGGIEPGVPGLPSRVVRPTVENGACPCAGDGVASGPRRACGVAGDVPMPRGPGVPADSARSYGVRLCACTPTAVMTPVPPWAPKKVPGAEGVAGRPVAPSEPVRCMPDGPVAAPRLSGEGEMPRPDAAFRGGGMNEPLLGVLLAPPRVLLPPLPSTRIRGGAIPPSLPPVSSSDRAREMPRDQP